MTLSLHTQYVLIADKLLIHLYFTNKYKRINTEFKAMKY